MICKNFGQIKIALSGMFYKLFETPTGQILYFNKQRLATAKNMNE